jgi:hypothetical protein
MNPFVNCTARKHPVTAIWVPHPRHVFVFVARVGYKKPHPYAFIIAATVLVRIVPCRATNAFQRHFNCPLQVHTP